MPGLKFPAQILKPVKVPERITLLEALYWGGFQLLPANSANEQKAGDVFEGHRTFYPSEEYGFVDDEEYQKELPTLPIRQDEMFDEKVDEYFDLHDGLLDGARASLFQSIKDGKLDLYGSFIKEMTKSGQEWQDADSTYWKASAKKPLESESFFICSSVGDIVITDVNDKPILDSWILTIKIKKTFFRLEGIDWKGNAARSPNGWYNKIWLNTEQLLNIFPVQQQEQITLDTINGAIMLATHEPKEKNRGRPSYDWGGFYLELTTLIKNDDLPNKQDALIQHMMDWCKRNWGREVGRSTILEKVSPFHKKFIRKD